MGTESYFTYWMNMNIPAGFIVLTQIMGTERWSWEARRKSRKGSFIVLTQIMGTERQGIPDYLVTMRKPFHCIDPDNGDWKLLSLVTKELPPVPFHCIDPDNGDWKTLASCFLYICSSFIVLTQIMGTESSTPVTSAAFLEKRFIVLTQVMGTERDRTEFVAL